MMRITDAWLRCTGARLLLAIGTLFPTVVCAGPGVWTSGGPYGGDVRALAISPTTPATLYAGTIGGGVFKSTDSGGMWFAVNSGLTNLTVRALAINPTTPATLYAGTTGGGVFKSTDSGGTWVAVNSGLPNLNVRALAINPSTPTTFFAGTDAGVFKSTNAGSTWAAANTGLTAPHVTAMAINPVTPSTLYAAFYDGPYGGHGLIKSTDFGATWAGAGFTGSWDVEALAIDPVTPSTLYAGGEGGVSKSANSGSTWSDTFLATPCGTGLECSVYVHALAINPTSPATLYAGGYTRGPSTGGVFKSTNSGGTWANTGLTIGGLEALAINPATPATLFAGTTAGISKSIDSGATWASINTGLKSQHITALAINPSAPATLHAGTDGGGIYKSDDSGGTWTAANTGLTNVSLRALAIDRTTPATLYAGTADGVFKSTDSGSTWAAASTGLTVRDVNALAIDPFTPATIYAGTADGIFKSTNAAGGWVAVNTGLFSRYVIALAIDPSTPTTLYAGTVRNGIFKSTDAGGTWTFKETSFFNLWVFALAFDPITPTTLYAGANGVLLKSIDSGGTWTTADVGLPARPFVYALAIDSATPTTVYAGIDGGVFKSTNSAGTWTPVNTGLPNLAARALTLDRTGATTLYVGLDGGGVWQATPPPLGANNSTGFVPIVLDVMGLAHYTSELQITNLGVSAAAVKLSYTSSIGSGSGDVTEIIPAGQQVVYPDAIAYLRLRGVPIPASGNQGGTLLLSAPGAFVRAMIRTGADTSDPQPVGRAGLAYTDTDPTTSSSATKVYVYGLRTNDADRSNLAVYNMGADPVSLKVTVVSGDDGRSFEVTVGQPRVLPAYGWYQYSGVLNGAGFSSGYAIVERVAGSGPFGAYGVVNDQVTSDGSFIPAVAGTQSGNKLTVPVLVETNAFDSELILTNRGSATTRFTLRYVESLSPDKGTGGTTTVDVAVGRQMIIPRAIDFLRSKGMGIGVRGEASYAGSLQVQVSSVGLESVFAGARTSSLSPAGGQFGVFYPGIDSSQEASDTAFVLGLKSDVNNRSNVAVLHTGDGTSGPIALELQVLDGSEGGKAVGQPLLVTLNPGGWAQPSGFFASGNVPNGYVRIRRTAGTATWYAYGVINDGGQPGQRTGDGAYIPMTR